MIDLDFGRVRPNYTHYKMIKKKLINYYEKDIWFAENFNLFSQKYPKLKFNFSKINNTDIRNEIKFYFQQLLKSKEIRSISTWNIYKCYLLQLTDFLNIEMPKLSSIVYLNKIQLELFYYKYLKKTKINFKMIKLSDFQNSISNHTKFILEYYEHSYDIYDTQEETEKDEWRIRKLGVEYNKSLYIKYIFFTKTPSTYRELLKKYIKLRLITLKNLKCGSCMRIIEKLNVFFNYIYNEYSHWLNLNNLQRKDILGFIEKLRKTRSTNTISRIISFLETFILYMQRYEWKEAPNKNVNTIIFPEDKLSNRGHNKKIVKYIPDNIWEQVLLNLDKIKKEYIPLILVLEASGFRISDVCTLKMDCIDEKNDGYWLFGKQQKVDVENHRVPISIEIAKVIKTQIQYVKSKTNVSSNPNKYLFPVMKGKRKGMPISQKMVVYHLNKLSKDCNMVNNKGETYIFNNHAFRHRYGVMLINNGMNILHVQKLMAHASPEMTMVYAQMFDNTIRQEWEKVKNNGVIKIDSKGCLVASDIVKEAKENGLELEWIRHNLQSIRLENGFCIKNPKISCDYLKKTLEPPCIQNKCHCFHVDQTFLSHYDDQIKKMEADIDTYEKTNRRRLIEIIAPKLKWYKEIRKAILNNGGVFGKEKTKREYVADEREKVNSNG